MIRNWHLKPTGSSICSSWQNPSDLYRVSWTSTLLLTALICMSHSPASRFQKANTDTIKRHPPPPGPDIPLWQWFLCLSGKGSSWAGRAARWSNLSGWPVILKVVCVWNEPIWGWLVTHEAVVVHVRAGSSRRCSWGQEQATGFLLLLLFQWPNLNNCIRR